MTQVAVRGYRPELTARGGPRVLARTLEAVDAAGLRLGLIEAEHDPDTPADARTLLTDQRLPAAVTALPDPR